MLKVLLIGGTGIISSDVTELAARTHGIDLYLLNRGNTPRLFTGNATMIRADINRPDEVRGKLAGMTFDVVADFLTYNVESLERKLDLFRGITGQYVFISSCAAYRYPRYTRLVTEANTPAGNMTWSYGFHKTLCERRLIREREQSGLRYTIVRPAYTYNNIRILHPYTIDHWVSWTVAKRLLDGKPYVLHDDGQQLCTPMHASDFARAFVGLWGNPAALDEAFHITSSEYLTWKRIGELTAAALGVTPTFCFAPAEELCLVMGPNAGEKIMATTGHAVYDNAKIRAAVPGFDCAVYFREGVKKTIQFYLDHPEYQKTDAQWERHFDVVSERFHHG